MGSKIDFYFIDKVNFHKRNFNNFITYVEENYTFEYNNAYPALKGSFGKYHYKNISGLPKFEVYEELYSYLSINKINNLNDIYSISYKGYNLWTIVRAELYNYLSAKLYELYAQGEIRKKLENESLIEWLVNAYDKEDDDSLYNIIYYNFAIASFWIDYWPSIFKNKKVQNICVFGGTTIFSKVATLVGQWNNINVIAFEGVFLKKFHYADNASGIITNNHRSGDNSFWKRIESLDFLENQQKWLYKTMLDRKNLNVIQPKKMSRDEIYEKYQIDKNKKIVLLIGQVINDFSITHDLKTYSSTLDFYLDVIKNFEKQDDYHLFVKLHPWENHKKHNTLGISKKVLEMEIKNPNVTLDYNVNIESLIEVAEFGITSCSQSGIEMLYEGKRVIQVGNAFYGGKGWTIDVQHRRFLEQSIQLAKENPTLDEKELNNLKKYLYHILYNNTFMREEKDPNFTKKFLKIANVQKVVIQTDSQNIKDKSNPNKKGMKQNNITKTQKIVNLLKHPYKIPGVIKRKIKRYRERNYKIVNMVMGNKTKSKIFEDMLKRFEIELQKNKIKMVVSVNPVNKADVYHYWRPNTLKVEMKTPAISTVHHDLERDSESLSIRHFIDAYNKSDSILCLNRSQQSLLKNYLENENIHVIPHGYDKRFKPKEIYKEKINFENKLIIGFSSRRYDRLIKGEEMLYQAIELLKDAPVKFIFIGQDRKVEHEFCQKNGIESEVYENLDYSLYPELYRKMDLFLITSKAEGGPASLPEALASGLPVISTPCGFAPEMIKEDVNGYIVEYDNHQQLVNRINEFIKNPKKLKLMGKKSLEVEALKSWEDIIKEYVQEYKKYF